MSTKSELKLLQRRIKRLHDHLESVRAALAHASGAELHVAVAMATRIMNMTVATFDVGVADGVVTYDINSRVVRLRREDKDEIVGVRQRILSVYEQMLAHLDTKTNEVAKAVA